MSKPNNNMSLRRSARNEQKSKRKPLYLTQQHSSKPEQTKTCKINLRKRDKKPTYKEIVEDTPKKPNPLSVFEFDDSDYEYESESSSTNDEDNSMRSVVKKLQHDYKKQPRIEILEAIKSKHVKNVAKPVQIPYGITILTRNNTKTETTSVQNKNNIDLDPEEEEVDVVEPAISNDSIQIDVCESPTNESTKSNTPEPEIIIEDSDNPEIVDVPEIQIEPDNNDPVTTKWRNKAERKNFETSKHAIIILKNSDVPDHFANKNKIKSKINNKNKTEINMDESIDKSNSEIIIDKTVQNKKLIDDLTQSFTEDDNTRNKLKIISDVVVRPADKEIPKFAKPWRMHVFSDKKQPYAFTYKNKSFTPRYEPDYNYKLTTDNKVETKEIKKPVYQTSITNFLKGEKPKIINNNELFNEPKKQPQSPRKALIEINFIQSTPVKTSRNNTINIPHDISAITSSPKIPSEKTNLFEQIKSSPIRKKTSPLPIMPQKEIDVTDDNMTLNEIPLFQEPQDYLEVTKKPKKPVRKYQKRKRLPSFEVNIENSDTDTEIDVVTVDEPQKKKKFQRTKEEDLEADRLANAYNTMFEEIEKHELMID